MSALRVAHRAGNDLAALAAAVAAGADVVEADVHLRRGRLEVRHAKSLGPLPWLWEPWYLVRDEPLHLADLAAAVPAGTTLMLDLKGWQPWLGVHVRSAMAGAAPYAVCSRHWRTLDAFSAVPEVKVVHSVRSRFELRRLGARLGRHRTWGLAVHRDLLDPPLVRRLRMQAEVVMTWPVDDAACLGEVLRLGVDGVISNRPDVLASC